MATSSRQSNIFGIEDWKSLYKTFNQADFQSYNFETLRKSFIDYLKQHHPETFNDYTESSEFVALLDLMAFMGQALSFRTDLNSRENFLDTAERRDSVTKLASLVGYNPARNQCASGLLKVTSISTTESVRDYNSNNLGGLVIRWNDRTNPDWQEQFTAILNAVLVDSQTVGRPGRTANVLGISTAEYSLRTTETFIPAMAFDAVVNDTSMNFEVTSATSQGKDYIYEPAPRVGADFTLLYRNDNLGFASVDTGYFTSFKQGSLQNRTFTLSDRIANRNVDINIENVNNSDVWLYELDPETNEIVSQWTQVENIYAIGEEQNQANDRKFFSISNRANDQITLNFGDGVFSQIPVGTFKLYVRTSNSLEYVINPTDIRNINVSMDYVSRNGRVETATMTVSLTKAINNSKNRDALTDIKRKAPARYYTQNRMVNGEDYNNFPYTTFGSIIKSKAVTRTNIGASRYLDLVDPTGKYSSVNAFGSDGLLYKTQTQSAFNFTFVDTNDIDGIIRNQVEPTLAERSTVQFYYDQFTRNSLTELDLSWYQATVTTNETTGYFVNSSDIPQAIGEYASDNRQRLVANALVKFSAPDGYYFNKNNRLIAGVPSLPGDKLTVWTSIKEVSADGTNFGTGQLPNGFGPVSLSDYIPTDAIAVEVIPQYNTDLTLTMEQAMLSQIEQYKDFGLRYDNQTGEWFIITANNLDVNGEFNLANAGDTSNTGVDASWLVKFISNGSSYTVTTRSLRYFFGSVLETRFFFDSHTKIYNPKTGKTVDDYVTVLKTNNQPDSSRAIGTDIKLDIIGQVVETDGFVNNYNVEVSYADSDLDGVADNPDFFSDIVAPTVSSGSKKIFLQRTVDFDNLERYLPVESTLINNDYAVLDSIEVVKTEFQNGQLFYVSSTDMFYELQVSGNTRTLVERTDFVSRIGRQDIQFQYKHNSPDTARINPGISNIIDIYLVTASYYRDYLLYMRDTTRTVELPTAPTIDELFTDYERLQDYKMISDNIVLNSVKFKPLFGNKADERLQAYIKVVKPANSTASVNEIKSQVIESINKYFDINNWDFGDTFYFSELAAYLHKELGDLVGSVVLVPKDPSMSFGDLYEVRSATNEIFISSATVDDVEVITSLSASQLTSNSGAV